MNVMFQQSAIMWKWPRTTGDRTWVWYGLAGAGLCPRLCLVGAAWFIGSWWKRFRVGLWGDRTLHARMTP